MFIYIPGANRDIQLKNKKNSAAFHLQAIF